MSAAASVKSAALAAVPAGERVAFETDAPQPAFYVVGQAGNGARLIKLEDVGGEAGLPSLLTRPGATADPIGAHVATGWFGPGASYSTAPAGAYEQRTKARKPPRYLRSVEDLDEVRAALNPAPR